MRWECYKAIIFPVSLPIVSLIAYYCTGIANRNISFQEHHLSSSRVVGLVMDVPSTVRTTTNYKLWPTVPKYCVGFAGPETHRPPVHEKCSVDTEGLTYCISSWFRLLH